jgi:hypothetical protein
MNPLKGTPHPPWWPGGQPYRDDAVSPGKADKCDCDDCACKPDKPGTVLEEAARIVGGSRNEAYGDPAGNHGTTAEMWTAYLRRRGYLAEGARVDARDVCWLNTLQKASRDAFDRRRDNLVDTAGYMRNAELVSDPAAPEHAEPSEAGAPLPAGVHADLRATGTAGD